MMNRKCMLLLVLCLLLSSVSCSKEYTKGNPYVAENLTFKAKQSTVSENLEIISDERDWDSLLNIANEYHQVWIIKIDKTESYYWEDVRGISVYTRTYFTVEYKLKETVAENDWYSVGDQESLI